MAIGAQTTGSGVNFSGTSGNIPHPTSVTAGNIFVMFVTVKYHSAGSLTTPTGWTLVATENGGEGANSGNTGFVVIYVLTKISDGTEAATNLAISTPGATTVIGKMYQYSFISGAKIDFEAVSFSDSARTTSVTYTSPTDMGLIVGDVIIGTMGYICASGDTRSTPLPITTTGCTFSAFMSAIAVSVGGIFVQAVCGYKVATGPSSGNTATNTMTSAGAGSAGCFIFLRMREVLPPYTPRQIIAIF
ncbi:MAG: hypothetical protein ABI002_09980 [Saprospiraceae bacterium]